VFRKRSSVEGIRHFIHVIVRQYCRNVGRLKQNFTHLTLDQGHQGAIGVHIIDVHHMSTAATENAG
jgi:hypothetical protein